MKRTNYQEKINFDIPLQLIQKGIVNADGDVVGLNPEEFDVNSMYLEGLASNDITDLQEQSLKPSGFVLDYFKTKGFINWNHQGYSPDAIIGEPVDMRVDKESFYLKSKLYPWSNFAKTVYKMGINLQNDQTSDRTLGYSVEGITLEQENNKVTKMLVTGCAVCFTPVNKSTYALVCKGITIDEVRDLRKQHIFKPIYQENGKQYILNLQLGEQQILVDTECNFEYRQNFISKASSLEEIQKAVITLATGVKEGFIKKDRQDELTSILKDRVKQFKLN